jgi:hypothetical protein
MKKPDYFKCPICEFDTASSLGWKSHMSKSHRGYSREQLQKAGIEESAHDRIKFMSGFKDITEVQAVAPETEGGEATSPKDKDATTARVPRLSKEERAKAEREAEFERLRPMLVRKWERRLRIPYSLWARLANDPKIALTDEEAEEGAELHVELMQAFGWIHAGKIEAVADLILWHGGTALGRSDLGQQLIASFKQPPEDESQNGKVN